MNDELVHRQESCGTATLQKRQHHFSGISEAYQLLFSRLPEPDELQAANDFLAEARTTLAEHTTTAGGRLSEEEIESRMLERTCPLVVQTE